MVFVKVRETYDLHTVQNKMTVIAIHTPKPDIIKKNYPGLLLQCKAYRPVSADVRLACASVLPLDPLGVGTAEGDVAPEDVFNPILYKAMSNKGMSQLESRINDLVDKSASYIGTSDVVGSSAIIEVDDVTTAVDEFPIYYGLLSNTRDWKHAHPQQGLSMSNLRPLVYDMVYNVGDMRQVTQGSAGSVPYSVMDSDGSSGTDYASAMLGDARPMPFIPCTNYTGSGDGNYALAGFPAPSGTPAVDEVGNASTSVNWLRVVCGAIIVPPSRRHELFFRMVVEWVLEFSKIRPISEITDLHSLARLGNTTHYQNYDYSSAKKVLTGTDDTILDSDTCMVSSNVDVKKVM